MRKLFVYCLSLLILLSLVGCRSQKDVSSNFDNSSSGITSVVINDDVNSEIENTNSVDTESQLTTQEPSNTTELISSTSSVTSVVTPPLNNNSSTVNETVSNTVEDVKDKIDEITDNIIPDITPVVPDNTPSSSDTANTSSNEEQITPAIPAEDLFKFGTVSQNTYENKFLGIGCNVGSDWTLLSNDEIKEYNGVSADATQEEIDEHILNSFLLVDMVASKEDDQSVIMVFTMSDLGTGSFGTLDMEEFMNSYVETTRDTMISAGYQDLTVERNDVTVDSKTFYGISASGEFEGVATYQTVLCIKTDYYITLIQITTPTQEETTAVVNSFYLSK